jgi:hypothetical protein
VPKAAGVSTLCRNIFFYSKKQGLNMRTTTTKSKQSTGKPATKQAKPTPAELEHQQSLAKIKEATTVAAALAQWLALRDSFNALVTVKGKVDANIREEDRLRERAASRQDYTAAQVHKDTIAQLEKEGEDVRVQLKAVRELHAAAQTHHHALFLADTSAPHNAEESVRICMARVIDPLTGSYDSVTYVDSGDTVQLSLSGKNFESEAYHISSWAVEHGFVLRSTEKTISL